MADRQEVAVAVRWKRGDPEFQGEWMVAYINKARDGRVRVFYVC